MQSAAAVPALHRSLALVGLVTQVRELLDFYKFDGAGAAIIRGSALKALEGDTGKYGKSSVLALLDAVDENIPIPPRDLEKPFLMPVEDVFSIAGRGTVATGRIESGAVALRAARPPSRMAALEFRVVMRCQTHTRLLAWVSAVPWC